MKFLLLSIGMILIVASVAHADEPKKKKKVIRYGDSITVYGVCKKPMKVSEAMHVMDKYFQKKGLRVKMHGQRGRFIYVDVFKDEKQVDRVILDRKTGKMRSIY